jgi:hypothetical protein
MQRRGVSLEHHNMKRASSMYGAFGALAALAALAFQTACGATVDLRKAVAPESVTTGWADGGVAAGKNRIVPAVSFRLRNLSGRTLGLVQVNAVFHRGSDPSEWTSGYLPDVARALPPDGQTDARTIAGQQGYTGTDDREDLLRNSQFVDASAELFVKSGSSNWTRIGEYAIARQLLSPPSTH